MGARISDPACETPPFEDHVHHHPEVQGMEVLQHLLRVRKRVGIPLELAVVGVPAGGGEAGAQIDQGVTGESLLTKCAGNPQDLFRA